MIMRRFVTALVLGILALSLSACGEKAAEKIAEKAIEKAAASDGSDVDVNIDGDEISIEGSDGTTIDVGSGDLPADFPSEIPLVDGEITSAIGSPDGWAITIAAGSMEEAVALLNGAGFTTDETLGVNQMAVLNSSDYEVLLTVSDGAGITYIVSKS